MCIVERQIRNVYAPEPITVRDLAERRLQADWRQLSILNLNRERGASMRNLTRKIKILLVLLAVLVLAVVFIVIQWWPSGPKPGSVLDEAKLANRTPESFPAADEDYFQKMDQNKDGIIPLTPAEVKGRDTWLVWTGGNDRLWDKLTIASFGALDLLKTISSHKGLWA